MHHAGVPSHLRIEALTVLFGDLVPWQIGIAATVMKTRGRRELCAGFEDAQLLLLRESRFPENIPALQIATFILFEISFQRVNRIMSGFVRQIEEERLLRRYVIP